MDKDVGNDKDKDCPFEIVNFNKDYWNEEIILNDLFCKSFEVREANGEPESNSSPWVSIKQKMLDLKNDIMYSSIHINSINVDSLTKDGVFYLYSKPYRITKPEHIEKLRRRIGRILFFSYRKNFPTIIDYNTNQSYTSDCGWGCMIRSGQMILARALYKVFRYEKTEVDRSMLYVLSLFLEHPLKIGWISEVYTPMIHKYIQSHQHRQSSDIISVLPPFSIKNIVRTGGFLEKFPGDWFSDTQMATIFSLINEYFSVVPQLNIRGMQNSLFMKDMIETCFTQHPKAPIEEEVVEYNNEKYYFERMGFFLVSIRLGLSDISPDYYESIKDLFRCKQCLGIIGGKNSSAYYFIGHDYDHLFFLDPHLSQNSVKELSDWESFIKKKLFKTKFASLQTAFSIGFLVKSFKDYRKLIEWVSKHEKGKFPCVTLSKKAFALELNENSQDDF